MSDIKTHARAVADVIDGLIVASVEIARAPDRVFQALTTPEIIDWWVNPGVFDTREWTGDVRVGGRWKASGIKVSSEGASEPAALRAASVIFCGVRMPATTSSPCALTRNSP